MSEQTNPEGKADEPVKEPSREEVAKLLADEMSKDPQQKPAESESADADQEPAENNNASDSSDEDSDEPSKDEEPTDEEPKKSKKGNVKKILEDRNKAREYGAEKATGEQELQKRVKELEDIITKSKGESSEAEGSDDGTDVADNKISRKDVEKVVRDILKPIQDSAAAEKMDSAEIDTLVKKIPEADKFRDKIKDIMKTHKTLSADASFRLAKSLAGEVGGDSDLDNTGKQKIGGRSKVGLREGKKSPEKMSKEELRKAAEEELRQMDVNMR